MAALATSSQVSREKYDVFISFRGLDIRYGLLSHLIKQLRQEGIDVYVDERLDRGEEISLALLEAIERSIIALVIFSKDYASSRWCLEELVKIMECKRLNNQIVIPVFYKVDPSHVRNQQEGSYKNAFAQHEQNFKDGLTELQVWRSVLEETANLSGYHSINFLNESDLIDAIIKDVSQRLEDKDTIEPKHLIGFGENLATTESFMKVDSQEVQVIGIWGKGGIGKTTLARAIFDKFSSRFDSSYFVSNVREESKNIGLPCLVEKILSVLLNDENLKNKGRCKTQKRLRRARVLLVLDDVDTSNQIQYIVEENLALGQNSKVIITSRDKHVLVSGGVQVIHEVKELNIKDSLQLFCCHAFKQGYPKAGYEKLSAQAIEYSRGLPLALKVLGSYLNSRDAKSWESALEKLRKYPNVEIQSVLRVSYDGLDISERRLFLDIAFFFKGEKKENITRVLDACDNFYVDCGIDRLLDKALIAISRENRVEIHDLLQEMAEEIVREESREHPEKRSRLNDAKEIQDVMENNKATDAIEGIILNVKKELYLSADTFQKMRKLRFLRIEPSYVIKGSQLVHHTVYLPDGMGSLSNELRYLSWKGYPLNSLPQGFSPIKLVEIHMLYSEVSKLWDGDLMNLKIVKLRYCRKLKELPDFSKAQNLEIVDLTGCDNLRSIHSSILSLPKLVSLNLSECPKLKNLHGENHLKSLKHLTLTHCTSLKELLLSSEEMRSLNLVETGIKTLNLPVGRFNKLEKLYLGAPLKRFQINELSCLTSLKIFSLFEFTEGIDESKLLLLLDAWRSLEELHLVYCEVYEIPDNIGALSLLKRLTLRGCSLKSLPNSIKHLSELKQIDLGECERLRSIPELPPSVTQFYVNECTSLDTIGFKVMRAIYNNYSSEVKVCYPGSTIPKGFKYSQTGKNSITVELAPSSSDHLLGFACCCILSSSDFSHGMPLIFRKFHFEDEVTNYKDDTQFPCLFDLSSDHVFIWYDPMERILNETQRRRFDEGTTHQKFAYKFFLGGRLKKYDQLIKGSGIWPIYESELQETVQQTELKLENGIVTNNSSGPSENPNAEVAQQHRAFIFDLKLWLLLLLVFFSELFNLIIIKLIYKQFQWPK